MASPFCAAFIVLKKGLTITVVVIEYSYSIFLCLFSEKFTVKQYLFIYLTIVVSSDI